MRYMHASAVISEVVWSAVLAAQSHDIANDTMILSWNGAISDDIEVVPCVPGLRESVLVFFQKRRLKVH